MRIILKSGSFGRKQLKAYMNRKPLPAIVQINVGDSDHIRTIKHIILDMTSFDASKRPSSADMRRQIVRPEVVPPKTSTTLRGSCRCRRSDQECWFEFRDSFRQYGRVPGALIGSNDDLLSKDQRMRSEVCRNICEKEDLQANRRRRPWSTCAPPRAS